jgi:transcription initiation factor IIF auxiliary subunit
VQLLYPLSVQAKKAELKKKGERVKIRLVIGNTTEFLKTEGKNKYKWELYIRPRIGEKSLSELAEKVEIELDETFQNPKRTFCPK